MNGTQFMSAFLAYAVSSGLDILNRSNDVASISIDALGGLLTPFKRNVNELRNQSGQMEVADYILNRLSDSEMVKEKKNHVQDPYSLRCIPQIHGASLDAINYTKSIFEK